MASLCRSPPHPSISIPTWKGPLSSLLHRPDQECGETTSDRTVILANARRVLRQSRHHGPAQRSSSPQRCDRSIDRTHRAKGVADGWNGPGTPMVVRQTCVVIGRRRGKDARPLKGSVEAPPAYARPIKLCRLLYRRHGLIQSPIAGYVGIRLMQRSKDRMCCFESARMECSRMPYNSR